MKLQRKNRLRALSLGAVAVTGALTLTACGSDDTGGSNAGGSTAPANSKIDCSDAKGQLLADGSSAQKNAIDAWVKQYTASCKSVQINYKGSGSGAGITAFTQGQVAFAGSVISGASLRRSSAATCSTRRSARRWLRPAILSTSSSL